MRPRKRNYVNNRDFLSALVEYRRVCAEHTKDGKTPPDVPLYIYECMMKIATNYSKKPRFSGYSFVEDMIMDAVMYMAKYGIKGFNPDKSDNPFAYFTTVTRNAFFRRIRIERKELAIKFKMSRDPLICDDSGGKVLNDYDDEYIDRYLENYEESIKTNKPTDDE